MSVFAGSFICAFLLFAMVSCGSNNNGSSKEDISQITEVSYAALADKACLSNDAPPTVTIGSQTWMLKNLSETKYNNGDPIERFTNVEEWRKHGNKGVGAYAIYDNVLSNKEQYGLLYNWYAVADPRGLCPEGFRAPEENDFVTLLLQLGGQEHYDSESALEAIKMGGSSGFEALFGGWCCMDMEYEGDYFDFVNMTVNGAFWSITENEDFDDEAINLDLGSTWRSDTYGAYLDGSSLKENAYSVRCIKK